MSSASEIHLRGYDETPVLQFRLVYAVEFSADLVALGENCRGDFLALFHL